MNTFTSRKIPVNYDFPLFPYVSELAPNFVTYISQAQYTENLADGNDIKYPVVRSIFPRLISIDNNKGIDAFYLKIGDIILCRLNIDYVVCEKILTWKVINAFTKEIIFETTDLVLKYRIENNTVFDVRCDFEIDGKTHQIYKESVISSFKV